MSSFVWLGNRSTPDVWLRFRKMLFAVTALSLGACLGLLEPVRAFVGVGRPSPRPTGRGGTGGILTTDLELERVLDGGRGVVTCNGNGGGIEGRGWSGGGPGDRSRADEWGGGRWSKERD